MATLKSEQLIGRWEDQRDLKNLMGKICFSILLKQESAMADRFWSAREDISLGTNEGWYLGQEAVRGYYNAVHAHTLAYTDFMKRSFPEKMNKLSPKEQYGAGSMDVRPMDTSVIEIAEDGETARGIWYSRGTYNDITPQGPLAFWNVGIYACDFVRENNAWKVWHMLNFIDIHVPGGRSWGNPNPEPFPLLEAFAEAVPFQPPEPSKAETLYKAYYPGRPFQKLPEPPVPYQTFAETGSYGI